MAEQKNEDTSSSGEQEALNDKTTPKEESCVEEAKDSNSKKQEIEKLEAAEEALREEDVHSKKKTPLILKILAILLILVAVLAVPAIVLVIIGVVMSPESVTAELGVSSLVIAIVLIVALFLSAVIGAIFGVNLLRNKRRNARLLGEILIILTIVTMICDLMFEGLSPSLLTYLVRMAVLIAIATYLDPALSDERKLHRKLRKMEDREQAEEGTLGRDESGKGYIKLDFFNIFWIFVIGCLVGVVIETIYHFILFGEYQNRTGMLYGPFSPIYGFGAVLMTVALNRFYKTSFIIVFFVTAIIGGAFEYAVSWFMEFAFGIKAWDYTGTFLSIDGRTNGMYMFMWGVLGCIWIKLLLPYILKLINIIPWSLRYSITSVCALLMITNGVLTIGAFDSWFQRQSGNPPDNALEQFCDTYYGNEFMENRFQSMTIDPDLSTRTDA